MSDTIIEKLIKRKAEPIKVILQYLFIVLAVIFVLLGLFIPLLMLAGVLFGVIAYFAKMFASLEYEYLYFNKDFTVDRILGQAKRKRMAEFDLQRMEILAPEGSHRLDSYKNQKCVNYDFASKQEGSKPYVFIYKGDSEIGKVTIDMSDDLFKAIRDISPRKVFSD